MNSCENVSCSNGLCIAGTCHCDFGYVNVENVCEETCDSNPCEVLIFRLKSNRSNLTDEKVRCSNNCDDLKSVCCHFFKTLMRNS